MVSVVIDEKDFARFMERLSKADKRSMMLILLRAFRQPEKRSKK